MGGLITAAQEFIGSDIQLKALRWFQESTGQEKQQQFAVLYRGGTKNSSGAISPIDFSNAFHFYKGLAHQNAAFKWLEQNSQPGAIAEFFRLWEKPCLGEIRLKVPFQKQTDNLYEPNRTCNTSACAMVALYLKANISGDDAYYQVVKEYGDTTDHGAQTQALKAIGVDSVWCQDLTFKDLDESLSIGYPIVIGILHRGSLDYPTGGHMIVVIGRTAIGDYIVHDPYGSLLDPGGGYTGNVNNGNGVVYPRSILRYRWLADGDRSGWGRLFAPQQVSKRRS